MRSRKYQSVRIKYYLCTAFCEGWAAMPPFQRCINVLFNSNFLSSSMNQYETVFILTPVLSDDQAKETVTKFKTLLADNGAEIVNEEAWGLKKLAYQIQKKTSGFYNLLQFKAEPTVVDKLETAYRREEKVIRFMTVKLDKYAEAYAEKRMAKLGKKVEE